MNKVKNVLSQLMVEESGQNLIEYALVAGIIGLGAVVAMTTLKELHLYRLQLGWQRADFGCVASLRLHDEPEEV